PSDVACAFFTTTTDLDAEFPAHAARRLGWTQVALLCGPEINVGHHNPRAVQKCIRVLILYNTPRPQEAMRFAYLRGAQAIKADLEASRSWSSSCRTRRPRPRSMRWLSAWRRSASRPSCPAARSAR